MPDDLQTDDEDQPTEGDMRDFRAAKDEAAEARKQADMARRELAFAKAGIDTDNGVGKLLFQSYAGEANRDAVLEAAKEYGITPGTDPDPQPAVHISDDERRQSRERAALATEFEAPSGEQPTPDPKREAYQQFKEGRDAGMRLEDAGASYFHTLFAAAYNGDKRAQHDPVEFARRAEEG